MTDLFEESFVQKLDKVLLYLWLGFWFSTIAMVVVQIHCHPDSVRVVYFYERFNGQNKLVLPYIIRVSGWGLNDSWEYGSKLNSKNMVVIFLTDSWDPRSAKLTDSNGQQFKLCLLFLFLFILRFSYSANKYRAHFLGYKINCLHLAQQYAHARGWYLPLVRYLKLTVSLERSSKKTVSFEEQIISKDNILKTNKGYHVFFNSFNVFFFPTH